MINSTLAVGFDARGRPVLTYHEFDADGNTQVYNARRERDGWTRRQVSDADGVTVQWAPDASGDADTSQAALRWETLRKNRDRPRDRHRIRPRSRCLRSSRPVTGDRARG